MKCSQVSYSESSEPEDDRKGQTPVLTERPLPSCLSIVSFLKKRDNDSDSSNGEVACVRKTLLEITIKLWNTV